MKLAIDVYYFDNKAKIVGVLFCNWNDSKPFQIISFYKENVEEYESGNFYKRELPCIIELLDKLNLSVIDIIILDSFVYLDDNKKMGLGGYVYKYLKEKIPIIGVAKTFFFNNKKYVQEVFRGKSEKPLYISAEGIELEFAKKNIQNMHGNFRIPTLLKLLDMETKNLSDDEFKN